MIIEFYGLPGAGKTTLARKLSENADIEIIKVRSRIELLFYNFLYLIKHPIKFCVTLFYIFVNLPNRKLFYYKFTNCFLHHNAKYQKALKSKKKYAILDQGYFQNILSIFEKPLKENALRKYANYLLFPDLLLVFDLPLEEARKRMGERGYIPRQEMGEDYLQNLESTVMANNDLFKKIVQGGLHLKYATIDARKNIEDVQQNVKQFFHS